MSDTFGTSYTPVPADYELAEARLRGGATPDDVIQYLVHYSIPGAAAAAIVARVLPEVQRQRERDNQLKMYLGWLVMAGTLLGALIVDYLTAAGVLWYAAAVAFLVGLLLFLLSWRGAGRRMAREGAVLLIGLGVMVAAGMAIAPVLSASWTTYTDPALGLTLKYPLLWQPVVNERANGAREIQFPHRFDWARKNDGLLVYGWRNEGGTALTANQCVAMVKGWNDELEGSTIQSSRTRLVGGYPAGEVSTLVEMADGPAVASVTTLYGTAEGMISFEAYDLTGDLERTHRLMDKFVAGYVPRVAGPGAALPGPELACPQGYDAYVGDTMPFAACYPTAWLAVEVPAGVLTDSQQTVFSPAGLTEQAGAVIVARAVRETDWTVSDEDLLKRAREKLVESGGKVIEEPRIVTVAGRRGVESVSDHQSQTEAGQWLRYRQVSVAEGEWLWALTAVREGEELGELEAGFRVLVGTWEVRGE